MNTPARISNVPASSVPHDAFGAGSIGGSIVALFFLALDSIQGRPFFTPSLMGTVLFTSGSAHAVTDVRMDMVAYYTLVHFAVFGILGGAIAVLLRQVELHSKHPAVMLATIFLLAEVLFAVAASLVMPGVVAVVGAAPIAVANLLGAGGMAGFLLSTHRPDLWQKVKHAVHLA